MAAMRESNGSVSISKCCTRVFIDSTVFVRIAARRVYFACTVCSANADASVVTDVADGNDDDDADEDVYDDVYDDVPFRPCPFSFSFSINLASSMAAFASSSSRVRLFAPCRNLKMALVVRMCGGACSNTHWSNRNTTGCRPRKYPWNTPPFKPEEALLCPCPGLCR
jgi:hypothetical protein